MDVHDSVVALEIGAAKVAALIAHADKRGKLEVQSLAYGPSAGFDRWRIDDERAVAESVDSVLGKLERHIQAPIKRLTIGYASPDFHSCTGKAMTPVYPAGRAVKRQDIHTLVQTSRRVSLPPGFGQVMAVPRYYAVDGNRVGHPPEGAPATKIEVETHIVVGRDSELDQLERILGMGGREIQGIVPTALASGLGTLSSDGLELGATVVDIGAESTSIGVFLDGAFAYQAVIPMGSAFVTRDIMQLLNVDWDEAERLKCEEAEAWAESVDAAARVMVNQPGTGNRPMQKKVLVEIVESRLREIFVAIGQELEGFAPESDIPVMIVLTGGGSILPGTEHLCQEILNGKHCKVAQPRVVGRFAGQVASPMLATIVGVARYALQSDEVEMAPISGAASWRDRFRTLISRLDSRK